MQLQTSLPAVCFSSDFPDLVFTTTSRRAVVSVSAAGDADFFGVTLYPYDGVVRVMNLREVLDDHLRASGTPMEHFSIEVVGTSGDSHTVYMPVVYCSRAHGDAQSFLRSRFLSSSTVKKTYASVKERLSFFVESNTAYSVKWSINIRYGGRVLTVAIDEPASASVPREAVVSIDCGHAIVAAMLKAKGYYGANLERVLSWTVSVGARKMSYYLADGAPDIMFLFRNRFWALEVAAMNCVTSEKSTVGKSFALIGDKDVAYDSKLSRSYESESEHLSMAEARYLVELAESRKLRLVIPNASDGECPEVLIEPGDFAVNDADGEGKTVKILWRFASAFDRLVINSNARIFSYQFDQSFN